MKDRIKEGQMWLLFIIVMWVVLSLCGCKQVEYVPVKEVKTVELQQNGMFGVGLLFRLGSRLRGRL